MKKIICDKCGFEGESYYFQENFNFWTWKSGDGKIDLCKGCWKKLRKIIKNFIFKKEEKK